MQYKLNHKGIDLDGIIIYLLVVSKIIINIKVVFKIFK